MSKRILELMITEAKTKPPQSVPAPRHSTPTANNGEEVVKIASTAPTVQQGGSSARRRRRRRRHQQWDGAAADDGSERKRSGRGKKRNKRVKAFLPTPVMGALPDFEIYEEVTPGSSRARRKRPEWNARINARDDSFSKLPEVPRTWEEYMAGVDRSWDTDARRTQEALFQGHGGGGNGFRVKPGIPKGKFAKRRRRRRRKRGHRRLKQQPVAYTPMPPSAGMGALLAVHLKKLADDDVDEGDAKVLPAVRQTDPVNRSKVARHRRQRKVHHQQPLQQDRRPHEFSRAAAPRSKKDESHETRAPRASPMRPSLRELTGAWRSRMFLLMTKSTAKTRCIVLTMRNCLMRRRSKRERRTSQRHRIR